MKDNVEDEYFHRMKLDEIKEEHKKEIHKVNESIIIKEWSIDINDVIVKSKYYIEDIGEELKIKVLKNLKKVKSF